MLQDIAIEEFGHLEMVGKLIEIHTKDVDQTEACKSTLFAVKGMKPHLHAWSANYLNEGGDVVRDLRANIAAEAGARQTYESLIKLATDDGTLKTLHHLLTREISHTQMFMKALDSLDKLTDPFFGNVQPDETVKLYYNLSTDGSGKDERGAWNSEPDFEYIADPLKHSSKSGVQ